MSVAWKLSKLQKLPLNIIIILKAGNILSLSASATPEQRWNALVDSKSLTTRGKELYIVTYLSYFFQGNGAVQKGMPHKVYHGKTGRVYNVTPHGLGVIVNKRIRERIIAKRINIRVEHVIHSKCREDFLRRVHENERLRREARENKTQVTTYSFRDRRI